MLPSPPCDPIFAMLDAMISQGYADVPQPDIPENWREIPAEVRAQDLERIRCEQNGNLKEQIAAIEEANVKSRRNYELATRVLEEARERRKATAKARRVGAHRKWTDRISWREASMKARRKRNG